MWLLKNALFAASTIQGGCKMSWINPHSHLTEGEVFRCFEQKSLKLKYLSNYDGVAGWNVEKRLRGKVAKVDIVSNKGPGWKVCSCNFCDTIWCGVEKSKQGILRPNDTHKFISTICLVTIKTFEQTAKIRDGLARDWKKVCWQLEKANVYVVVVRYCSVLLQLFIWISDVFLKVNKSSNLENSN